MPVASSSVVSTRGATNPKVELRRMWTSPSAPGRMVSEPRTWASTRVTFPVRVVVSRSVVLTSRLATA